MPPKAAATATAAAAAAAAAAAMAATGTPHGRVPRRTAPTPPGLRDLSEAVLWAQTEAYEEARWARRAAEISDADALELADAAIARYDWRCALLAELFDGRSAAEAAAAAGAAAAALPPRSPSKGQWDRGEQATTVSTATEEFDLAATVRALEESSSATSTSTSTSTSSQEAAAASASEGEFAEIVRRLSVARTTREIAEAEAAYISFRSRRRGKKMRKKKGRSVDDGKDDEEDDEEEDAPPTTTTPFVGSGQRRRVVGPGLFEIVFDTSASFASPLLPDPPEGASLDL